MLLPAWLLGLLLIPAALWLPAHDRRAWPALLAAFWLSLLAGFAGTAAPIYWPLLLVLLLLLWPALRSLPESAAHSPTSRAGLARKCAALVLVVVLFGSWLHAIAGSAAGLPALSADVPIRPAGVADLLADLAGNSLAVLYLLFWVACIVLAAWRQRAAISKARPQSLGGAS